MSVADSISTSRRFTENEAQHRLSETIATMAIYSTAVVVFSIFAWLVLDVFAHGLSTLNLGFLLESPMNSGRRGGIGPIIVSTLLILSVCMVTALPLGLGAAIFLSELTSRESNFSTIVRRSLDILAGVPSIVFGLFGNALFCIHLGMGFSILSGGLTLACMVLPLLIRSAEEGLRSVPEEYRAGAAALALSKTRTLFQIIIPAALPGILVGLVLGTGRALAETAALIFTSGYVDRHPTSLLDSGRALSIHIYDLSMNVPGGNKNAYASATVLLILLFSINFIAGFIARIWRKNITKGSS